LNIEKTELVASKNIPVIVIDENTSLTQKKTFRLYGVFFDILGSGKLVFKTN
jgi:ABC-type Fe3+-hydroxamate transport system substrate-binding protein